jgi:hypothetical protein
MNVEARRDLWCAFQDPMFDHGRRGTHDASQGIEFGVSVCTRKSMRRQV